MSLINKLQEQITDKQDFIDGVLQDKINKIQADLQYYLNAKKKEEQEIAHLQMRIEEAENHKPGRLAKVSIYEFVNDWLRPEISFKILQYVADDPHKKGIKKFKTHRRHFYRASRYSPSLPPSHPSGWNGQWKWVKDDDHYVDGQHLLHAVGLGDSSRTTRPYSQLSLYTSMKESMWSVGRYEDMNEWRKLYKDKTYRHHIWMKSNLFYRHVNPLLHELWSFQATYKTHHDSTKFIMTKKDIVKYLKENKVVGRSDLTYGNKCSDSNERAIWRTSNITPGTCYTYPESYNPAGDYTYQIKIPPESRCELVKALMKME